MSYRKESLLLGLIPPEDHSLLCGCGTCKAAAPSLVELELSASQHPSKIFREMQIDFFNALVDLVTQYEEESLEIFNLPKIEVVRQSIITGDSNYQGKFEITPGQVREYKEMLSEWQHDLTADATLIKQDAEEDEQSAAMNWYLLLAFTLGLKRVKEQTIRNNPDDIRSFLENIDIAPDLNNLYLKAIRKDALKRVKIKIADDQRDFVLKKLRQMSKEGRNPLYTARQLHKRFEGQAWYWNRLARSESALALGASFDAWAAAARATHEKWSTGGSRPCPICIGLDGNIWKIGEGPHSVTDTHPHCFISGTRVQTYHSGYKEIEKIKVGDEVLTHTGNYRKVTQLHKHTDPHVDLIELFVDGKTIISTSNHPFLIDNKWVNAGDVSIGDRIKRFVYKRSIGASFTDVDILKITKYIGIYRPVYNLSVDVDESYIANGFVVHNCACERIALYNVPPQQVNPSWNRPTPYDQPYSFVRNDSGALTVPELGDLLN